ncbi:unnamed protein product [Rotaria sordida]|uniref:Cullin N-terminal domain-containing protein n=1 Tax=Rotaria sordida TaxID=392033 RepID=A0A819QIL0_9BILA|nr:unnamed protein product [Rotaria sordida]
MTHSNRVLNLNDVWMKPPRQTLGDNQRRNNVHDRTNTIGGELYAKLKNYLKSYLEKICEKGFDLQGESVLRFYKTNWEHYRFSSKVTNSFCHYLNRHWVRREYDSGRRDVYEIFTVIPYLQDTIEFYRREVDSFLKKNSVMEYLKKISQFLYEEEYRIQLYLHPSTLKQLIKKVEEVFIRDQLKTIYTEGKVLLHREHYSDLTLLFKLVSRIPNAPIKLKKIIEKEFHKMGIEVIRGVSVSAINLDIKMILEVYSKLLIFVKEVFNSKQDFMNALNNVCKNFINKNPVTEATGNTNKSSELLA